MNPQRTLKRKILYVAGMVVIALLLAQLGSPPVQRGAGAQREVVGGGVLADLRAKHNLSEAQIGELDPAGQTLKLATFGLRGVAVNILWNKAATYKMKKDWTNFAASLEQIAKLEPHFVKVWRFQAWELAYNVAVEFDDYRERYRWLLRGVDFLQEGMRYNQNEYTLVDDVGTTLGMKIGRADESKLYRQLFKQDDEFHGSLAVDQRDNWLVAKGWHEKAIAIVDAVADPLKRLKKATPVLFYRSAPMCAMSHAEFVEKDGFFGERAREAWQRAEVEWRQFGARQIPLIDDLWVVLNDMEAHLAESKRLAKELEDLEPGLREKIRKERYDALKPDEKRLVDRPSEQITSPKESEQRTRLDYQLTVTHDQVARRVSKNQKKALELAFQCNKAEDAARLIGRERDLVSFDNWRRTALLEQQPDALDARENAYKADEAFTQAAEMGKAKDLYAKSFQSWRKVFDDKRWPNLANDEIFCSDIIEAIQRYRKVLESNDEKFPDNFPLKILLPQLAKMEAIAPKAPPTEQPPGKSKAEKPGPGGAAEKK